MLQQSSDVVTGCRGQIAVSSKLPEGILAALPETLVDVHARTVVLKDRLGHEGGRLAVLARGILDAVLVPQHLVRHPGERVEPHVDLALTGCRDFMVMELDRHPDRLERQ